MIPAPSRLTANFRREEFETSRDGLKIPLALYSNVRKLAIELQKIRDVIGVPIIVHSGWRSKHYNESVGGASQSYHMLAMAADFSAPQYAGGDERQLHALIDRMIRDKRLHNGGLGLYPRAGAAGWVHYDVRRNPARWSG